MNSDSLHEPTVLERMRASVKEKRKPKLAEFSFIVPEFKLQTSEDAKLTSLGFTNDKNEGGALMQYYLSQKEE